MKKKREKRKTITIIAWIKSPMAKRWHKLVVKLPWESWHMNIKIDSVDKFSDCSFVHKTLEIKGIEYVKTDNT
jgi:hypothetical protein